MKYVLVFILTLILEYKNIQKIENSNNFSNNSKIVYLQPLGEVKEKYISKVVLSIEKFYGFKCIVKPMVSFTNDILAKSKTRYEASLILKKFESKDNIFILTEKDIAVKDKERKSDEWGIIGLGLRPGRVCVVSTFRLKKNVTENKVLERLQKIALHEVGHNLGLKHCNRTILCIMNDEKGKISTTDKEQVYLCPSCRKTIGI